MKVIDSELIKRYTRMAADGYALGWHERNGGNLSCRLTKEEAELFKDDFNMEAPWQDIGWQQGDDLEFPGLADDYFMISGSGKYFRNAQLYPDDCAGILQLNENGSRYRIVWGLVNGGRPSSELATHLANMQVCKARDPKIRVIYHCHPTNTVALTYVLPLDARVFTREIFEMATECPIVFPNGIGIVPWMLCGGRAIAEATAQIMKEQDIAVWAHHGAFCCGPDFDTTFGLMHTVEKAAEVLVKVRSMTEYKFNIITPDQFRELNEPFGVRINERFLYERKTNRIGEMPEEEDGIG